MASGVLVTTSSKTTTSGNINVSIQIRQTTSSSGMVKLQGRLYLSWTNYADVNYTGNVFDIYQGSNASGTKLLSSNPSWTRTASAGSTTTSWADLSEITNASSVSLYAVVKPNGSAASPSTLYYSFSVSGIKQTYSLSTSAGTGSTITVNRQSSGVAGTGNVSNGSVLYYGDNLKISATPNTNYGITSLKVNGSNFISGNTHSVTRAVSVTSTAQVLASDIGATDANIGSVSTITVSKYNANYYHEITISFEGLGKRTFSSSGNWLYITQDGTITTTETRFSSSSIAFRVPDSGEYNFYSQIPNKKAGTCYVTCWTYSSASGGSVLGSAKETSFTVTAANSLCSPEVSGDVIDTNEVTAYLTGDNTTLVRYKSTAQCTISASAKNEASITSKSINGAASSNDVITVSGDSLYNSSFVFSATDSRGYSSSATKTPTMIQYVKLTANPSFYRPSPTSGEVALTFSGNYYSGSFGDRLNQLVVGYRYRKSTDVAFNSWVTISSTDITISGNTYKSTVPILLSANDGSTTGFDYKESYIFEFLAVDGYNPWDSSTYRLSSESRTATVKEGVPVFDWGKEDFRFNVDVEVTGDMDVDGNVTGANLIPATQSTDGFMSAEDKTKLDGLQSIGYIDDSTARASFTLTNGYYRIVPPSLPTGAKIISVAAIAWTSSNGISIIPYGDAANEAYVVGETNAKITGLRCRFWYVV